jgi:hypothetical protein
VTQCPTRQPVQERATAAIPIRGIPRSGPLGALVDLHVERTHRHAHGETSDHRRRLRTYEPKRCGGEAVSDRSASPPAPAGSSRCSGRAARRCSSSLAPFARRSASSSYGRTAAPPPRRRFCLRRNRGRRRGVASEPRLAGQRARAAQRHRTSHGVCAGTVGAASGAPSNRGLSARFQWKRADTRWRCPRASRSRPFSAWLARASSAARTPRRWPRAARAIPTPSSGPGRRCTRPRPREEARGRRSRR